MFKLNKHLMKKAQITIFVILGLLILIIGIILLFMKDISKNSNQDIEIKKSTSASLNAVAVKQYANACVEKSFAKSIEINGIQDKGLISSFLNHELGKCNYSDFEEQGANITVGSITSTVIVNPGRIVAQVKYPLEVKQGDYTQRFESFFSEYMLTNTQAIDTDVQGKALKAQIVNSPNAYLSLSIPSSTIIKDSSGNGLESISVKIQDASIENEVITGVMYDLSPSGTAFSQPVKITLRYDAAIELIAGNEEDLVILYRHNPSENWVRLPTNTNKEANTLTAYIDSFSQVAIGLTTSEAKLQCDSSISDYLIPGEQTIVTAEILSLSKREIGGNNKMDNLINILHWLNGYHERGPNIDYDTDAIMARTAHQIIFDGFNRDPSDKELDECSDHALVFIALARSKGIPAKYIQTIDQDWLESQLPKGWDGSLRGHAFAEVYINNRWYVVNPQGSSFFPKSVEELTGEFTQTNITVYPYRKVINGKEYIITDAKGDGFARWTIYGEGYDAWDLGLHSIDDFKKVAKSKYFDISID